MNLGSRNETDCLGMRESVLELDALSLVLANVQNTSKPTDRLTHIPTSPTTCIKQSSLFLVPAVFSGAGSAASWLPALALGASLLWAGQFMAIGESFPSAVSMLVTGWVKYC